MRYSTGDAVEIGDVVDVGGGRGPRCQVVVVIEDGQAASGFEASEWAQLRRGVLLRDSNVFGLLHLEEFTADHLLVERG